MLVTSRVQLFATPWTPLTMRILQVRILEWVALPFSRDLLHPGAKSGSPALLAAALSAEPPGEPKNTGLGSLSLLQRIFLTQGSNGVSCIAGGFFTV